VCGDSFSGKFCGDFLGGCSSGTSGPHCENYGNVSKQIQSNVGLIAGLVVSLVVVVFVLASFAKDVRDRKNVIPQNQDSIITIGSDSSELNQTELSTRPIDDAVAKGKEIV